MEASWFTHCAATVQCVSINMASSLISQKGCCLGNVRLQQRRARVVGPTTTPHLLGWQQLRSNGPASRCIQLRATKQQEAEVPDLTYGLVGQFQAIFRALPLYAGGFGIVALLANRFISGVAPVVDASSSQSRADVLGIVISAVLLLTGLQWLSLKARTMQQVTLDGDQVYWVDDDSRLSPALKQELNWAWQALSTCTTCKSMVVMYDGRTLFQAGLIKKGLKPGNARGGDICQTAMKSGQGNYLANLVLYPGRLEFTSFLPENTQGVVVQPVGNRGVLVAGSDTVRGVGRLDQAWLSAIADKLEVALEAVKVAQPGRGFKAGSDKA